MARTCLMMKRRREGPNTTSSTRWAPNFPSVRKVKQRLRILSPYRPEFLQDWCLHRAIRRRRWVKSKRGSTSKYYRVKTRTLPIFSAIMKTWTPTYLETLLWYQCRINLVVVILKCTALTSIALSLQRCSITLPSLKKSKPFLHQMTLRNNKPSKDNCYKPKRQTLHQEPLKKVSDKLS